VRCNRCGSDEAEFYTDQDGQPYGPCKGCRCAAAAARYQATRQELDRLRLLAQVVQAKAPALILGLERGPA
jgi:hypothetical protein